MAQRMNPMAYQADLAKVLDAGRGSVVIGGELSRHGYLTKAKTEEEALKEMQDNKLSQKPITGFQFNVKDARVISGDGIGTIMEQIIVSGFKPNKDNSATFVECRCGHRMPKLYATENGQIVDISKEFEGKPVSYQGPVQVAYSLSKGKNDGRIYLNVDGVMFATKPDVFVPDENGGNGRDVSAAFAPTAFYGQAAAPAQPAGFAAQAAAPVQQAPVQQAPVQQAAPAQAAPTGFAQAAAPAQAAPVQQPAGWTWPQ